MIDLSFEQNNLVYLNNKCRNNILNYDLNVDLKQLSMSQDILLTNIMFTVKGYGCN